MPADDTYTTLLNFVSDSSQANRDIKATTDNLKKMEEQAKKVGTFTPAKQPDFSFRAIQTALKQEFSEIEKAAAQAGIRISAGLRKGFLSGNLTDADIAETRAIVEQIKSIKELEAAKEEELQETIRAHQTKISLYRREASVLSKLAGDIKQNAGILRNQADQIKGISQLAFGAGAGVAGGIFAFANKYVADAKVATETVKAWKAAQDSLNRSGQRTGEVFAQAALPLLQKAADIATKASRFLEQHPEIAQAALNAGLITAGLGAVGLAVSKGIRLYADHLYLSSIPLQIQAGNLQLAAAHEQLLAARIKAGLPTEVAKDVISKGESTGALGLGKTVIGGLIATVIGAEIGKVVGNKIGEIIAGNRKGKGLAGEGGFGIGDVALGAGMLFQTPAYAVTKGLNNLGLVSDQTTTKFRNTLNEMDRFVAGLIGANKILNVLNNSRATGNTPGTKGGRSTPDAPTRFDKDVLDKALAVYEDYKADDLQLVRDHYNERKNIISNALQAENAENADFAADNAKIRANLSKSIASATASFNLQEERADQQNAEERARVIRDGGKEIENIEEQLQERLRKLRLEHGDRDAELLAARDAVGLVKERQRYNRETNEEQRQANLEIRKRRADLAERLEDLRKQQEQERAQRLEDFKIRIAELQAQAKEQLAERAQQHAAEIKQIHEQAAAKIKELDNQFAAERKRRYEQFLQQLRDIDAGLLGERKLRQAHQTAMLKELDDFLIAYKTKMGTLLTAVGSTGSIGTIAHNSSGGYAGYGLHLLGDAPGGGRGKPEYVLGGDLTELAERVLGGRISREGILALLSGANGGSRNNIVYNDSRKIESRVSNTDRQRLLDDSLEVMHSIVR